MARRLADNITSDHLSCPICRDTVTDPRILPCEHTLCLECLTQLIQSSRRLNKFNCPVDRHEITTYRYGISAEDWAKSFPKDDLALALIQTINGEDKTIAADKKYGIPCDAHPLNICEFFCFGCCKPACSECAVERHKHNECDCKLISKCKDKAHKKLQEFSGEIANLFSYGQDIVSRQSRKDRSLIQSSTKIQTTIIKLKNIIQNFEKLVSRKLIDILGQVDDVAGIERTRERAKDIVEELGTIRFEVEEAKSLTSITDVLHVLEKIPNRLHKHTDSLYTVGYSNEPIELKLELNQLFLKLCDTLRDQDVGKVYVVPADSMEFEDTKAVICGENLTFSSDVCNLRAVDLDPFLVIKYEHNDQEMFSSARFGDLILLGHSIIAVDQSNSKLVRFRDTVQNQFVDECYIPGIHGITSVHNNDDIVITVPRKGQQCCLSRMSIYNGLTVVKEIMTDKPYFNICQLPDDKYGVICHITPKTSPHKKVQFNWTRGVRSHIDIIDIDGHILSTLSESLLCKPQEFGSLFIMPLKCICGLPNGDLVVSMESKTSSCITYVSQSGQVKWTYTPDDKVEGICCNDSSIYVYLRVSNVLRVLSLEGDLEPRSNFKLPNYNGDGNTLVTNKTTLAVADNTDILKLYHLQ